MTPITKTCRRSGKEFTITDRDQGFYAQVGLPHPTLCPEERMKQMLTWRNEYQYYTRKCDKTSQPIISTYKPESPYKVYSNKAFWSDDFDAREYGQDVDFSKPFFEQFIELHQKVPQITMVNDNGVGSENCEYCQDFAFGKNCYLVSGSWRVEDSLYSNNCNHGKDIVDCKSINVNCELVYESKYCQRLYNCSFLDTCSNSSDCHFGYDLMGCKNCFGCIGLRQKEYCFFNEQLTKEEYQQKMGEIDLGSYAQLEHWKAEFARFASQQPRKESHQINCDESEGNHLYNCKDVHGEDNFNCAYSRNISNGDNIQNCYDIYQSGNPQWCCGNITPDDSYMVHMSVWCWKSQYVMYSDNCHSSQNCFGCVSLKRQRFCILNKQYTEEEYNELLPRIIEHMKQTGEWGEFFPAELSPFAYNESLAQEKYPMSKEQIEANGLKWYESVEGQSSDKTTQIPDHIKDVTEEICKTPLTCISSGKAYRITPAEFKFYKKMKLPIPRKAPAIRRVERFNRGEN